MLSNGVKAARPHRVRVKALIYPDLPLWKHNLNTRGLMLLPHHMSIRVALHHQTVYKYDRPVSFGPHVVRLRQAPHCRTPITSYSLKITPSEHFVNWQQDPFGNYQARFVFPKAAQELKVEVDLVAEMTTINPFDFFIEDYKSIEGGFQGRKRAETRLGLVFGGQTAGNASEPWSAS